MYRSFRIKPVWLRWYFQTSVFQFEPGMTDWLTLRENACDSISWINVCTCGNTLFFAQPHPPRECYPFTFAILTTLISSTSSLKNEGERNNLESSQLMDLTQLRIWGWVWTARDIVISVQNVNIEKTPGKLKTLWRDKRMRKNCLNYLFRK